MGILANLQAETAIGLASALILVKAYANWLLVEVNQICYGGIVRTIALGFTEGISSWKVESLCTFQPLLVPVGRSTLGKLFNVLSIIIDIYIRIDELPIYLERQVSFNQYESEHSTQEKQKLEFSSHNNFSNTIKIHTEAELQSLDFSSYNALGHLISRLRSVTQNIRLESLGMLTIMGLGIIKTNELEIMSFSNVSSAAAQAKLSQNIIDKGNIGLVQLKAEMKNNGIKGSVARDRNLSPIHKAPVRIQSLSVSLDLFETGIKVVDLLTPYKKGGKIGLFGGAGVEKTIVIIKLICNLAIEHSK